MSAETGSCKENSAENSSTDAVSEPARKVFLLEDDPLIADNLETALEDYGWEVTYKITTVEEGLRIAQRAVFDVAILDVNLKGKKSYAVANVLSMRNIPILLCTGYSAEIAREQLPNIHILEKPFSSEQLHAALEQICR